MNFCLLLFFCRGFFSWWRLWRWRWCGGWRRIGWNSSQHWNHSGRPSRRDSWRCVCRLFISKFFTLYVYSVFNLKLMFLHYYYFLLCIYLSLFIDLNLFAAYHEKLVQAIQNLSRALQKALHSKFYFCFYISYSYCRTHLLWQFGMLELYYNEVCLNVFCFRPSFNWRNDAYHCPCCLERCHKWLSWWVPRFTSPPGCSSSYYFTVVKRYL